jgi:hypothetical protein
MTTKLEADGMAIINAIKALLTLKDDCEVLARLGAKIMELETQLMKANNRIRQRGS